MSAGRVVLGVIGDDIHVVGNRIIQLVLEDEGYQVFNLGVRRRPEHFRDAALEVDADAVFVSSLNGEGEYWCVDFRRHFIQVGIPNVLLYVGGNLVVGKRAPAIVEQMFKGFGFDRVYHQTSNINAALADLRKDLSRVHAQF